MIEDSILQYWTFFTNIYQYLPLFNHSQRYLIKIVLVWNFLNNYLLSRTSYREAFTLIKMFLQPKFLIYILTLFRGNKGCEPLWKQCQIAGHQQYRRGGTREDREDYQHDYHCCFSPMCCLSFLGTKQLIKIQHYSHK